MDPDDPKNKEVSGMNKNGYRWLWFFFAILAIVVAVLATSWVVRNQHEKDLQAQRIAQLETISTSAEQQKNSQNQYPVEIDATKQVDLSETNEISVYRGATDQETIDYNDAWPGYYSYEQFSWFDNRGFSNIHLKGGTYVMPCSGVISGDVKVNGDKLYDNNEHTFLVITVQQGDQVYVNPDWQARFSTELSKETVVISVQTQFPTWTRQPSALN
jgi:hypothetical protein